MGKKNHRLLLFSPALVIFFLWASLQAERCSSSGFEMKNELPAEEYADVRLDILVNSETKVIEDRVLNIGETLKWGATQNAIYYVLAVLGNIKFASVRGFDPTRDASHETVFWLIKEDGFYFSYDNASWKMDSQWDNDGLL